MQIPSAIKFLGSIIFFKANKTSLQKQVVLLQKGFLLLQENLYMLCILLAQNKLVLKPVTCIALLMRNFMKSEVNIQAMHGVLIDIILIFFPRQSFYNILS